MTGDSAQKRSICEKCVDLRKKCKNAQNAHKTNIHFFVKSILAILDLLNQIRKIMPKQIGQVKILGTIDDRIYYKTKYGYISRAKGNLNRERILNDPCFERTRENMSEFSRAATAGCLFRKAFFLSTKVIKDGGMYLRLNKLMRRIMDTDHINERGHRKVTNGDIKMLKGFNFNEVSNLDSILSVAPQTNFMEDQVSITLGHLLPESQIDSPKGASHARFFAVCGLIDFDNTESKEILTYSDYLSLKDEIEELVLKLDITGYEAFHKFIGFGIEFAEKVNDHFYHLKDKSNNAMTILEYKPAMH